MAGNYTNASGATVVHIKCLVHLHGLLEPAISAVDSTAVAVNHLFGQADIATLWSFRD